MRIFSPSSTSGGGCLDGHRLRSPIIQRSIGRGGVGDRLTQGSDATDRETVTHDPWQCSSSNCRRPARHATPNFRHIKPGRAYRLIGSWEVDLGPMSDGSTRAGEGYPALDGSRAAPADVSLVRIDSSVRSIDSRAAELMSRPMKTRRTTGMDRLSVSDSHSTITGGGAPDQHCDGRR